MKINYDKMADAMYFQIKEGTIAQTLPVNESVIIDVDKNGETLGIELLDASSRMGLELEKNLRNGIQIQVVGKRQVTA